MKNKKGFTLVELLAVIVILALIMGIAVVGIGNVLSTAKENAMWENAQAMIDGLKKSLAISSESYSGNTYTFDSTAFESGGTKIGDNEIVFGSSSDGTAVSGTVGIWKLSGSKSGCSATTKAYITFDANGVATICLPVSGAGNKYINGTQNQISQRASAALKTNS